MSFDFNSTQRLEGTENAYPCIHEWTNRLTEIICVKYLNHLFFIIRQNHISFFREVKEVSVAHKCELVNESSADGFKVSKHYNLRLIGKDISGQIFTFKASLYSRNMSISYASEDERIWRYASKDCSGIR